MTNNIVEGSIMASVFYLLPVQRNGPT
jgi:hypothetical protein